MMIYYVVRVGVEGIGDPGTKTKGAKISGYQLVSSFFNLLFNVFINYSKINVRRDSLHYFRTWPGEVGKEFIEFFLILSVLKVMSYNDSNKIIINNNN